MAKGIGGRVIRWYLRRHVDKLFACSPPAIEALAQGLKNMGVPMYLTGMARELLGKDHPLQFRHHRSKALKEADLVLNFGMPCDFRLNYGQSINKKAFYIAVNRSKTDLRKNRRPATDCMSKTAISKRRMDIRQLRIRRQKPPAVIVNCA